MTDLETEAGVFGASLIIFAKQQKLPASLFDHPDHFVLQASDLDDFIKLNREEVTPRSQEMFCIETDLPFKTAARLRGKIALYDLGFIDWLAVEEPKRQSSASSTTTRAEFYTDSLERAVDILRRKGIRSRIVAEKDRAYVGVPFDTIGSEFRFTDTPLEYITLERYDSDEALSLELPPRETTITIL